MTPVFPSAYFPNIAYLKRYFSFDAVAIEVFETFPKQTLRNRCDITTSMGRIRLSIPVKKPKGSKTLTKDICIDTSAPWKKEHWRGIQTAYAAAPYFEEYAQEVYALIHCEHKYLTDLNGSILNFIHTVVDIPAHFSNALEYAEKGSHDYRDQDFGKLENSKEYLQVFTEAHGFVPNLSILDLLFNEGPFMRNWIL